MRNASRVSGRGVTRYVPSKTYHGYTLIAPFGRYDAWLIDMTGRIVHQWKMPYRPGHFARLLPNGNLLYSGRTDIGEEPKDLPVMGREFGVEQLGGFSGHLIEVTWEGRLVWKYDDPLFNHDFCRLENGNTIAIRYVRVPEDIKNRVGGGIPVPGNANAGMWSDELVEITADGRIVWKWAAHKHLDPETDTICPREYRSEWTHMNTCSVLPNGDILGAFRQTSIICIIDKGTGDIKWKWGPGKLAHPHEPSMLKNGKVLVFDNGEHRFGQETSYSRILEVNPATNRIEWEYKSDPPTRFYSSIMGGCQRLPNGNTLVCDSAKGCLFEVTHDGEVVWEYVSPFYGLHEGMGMCNALYRSYRYGPDYEGLQGRTLNPDNFRWINKIFVPEEKDDSKAMGVSLPPKCTKTYDGLTMFTPLGVKNTTLIDMRGRIVHQWKLPLAPALYGELLSDSRILYAGYVRSGPLSDLEGAGGELLEVDWKGKLLWRYRDPYLHHAFYRMSNGNTMVLRWVKVPEDVSARVKGGIPRTGRKGVMWGDSLQEVTPKGKVVWEWLSYEHLDPEIDAICPLCRRNQWTEANSCFVLTNGDILVSFRRIGIICIIARKTGDIKWRWGHGEVAHQNDATMLENGNVLLFDNGYHAEGVSVGYSRVLEINPLTNKMAWEYKGSPTVSFYSSYMSSCQRLPNGNTLVCETQTGRIFEVTREGEVVWEFLNPSYVRSSVYGHSNSVPRARRYGPEYRGLPTPKDARRAVLTRQNIGEQEKKPSQSAEQKAIVRSRLERLGY